MFVLVELSVVAKTWEGILATLEKLRKYRIEAPLIQRYLTYASGET